MNYSRIVWVVGGVIAASMLDLVYMFWSRSNPARNFNRAGWGASALGKGRYDIMKMGKVFHK